MRCDVWTDAFYSVNSVWENSPASSAGLKTGDRILAFGSINRSNNALDKTALPALVTNSEGRTVTVIVHRTGSNGGGDGGGNLKLTLIPQKWSGKGLLG